MKSTDFEILWNEKSIKEEIRQNKAVYGIKYKDFAKLVDIGEREFYNWLNNGKKLPLMKQEEIWTKLNTMEK